MKPFFTSRISVPVLLSALLVVVAPSPAALGAESQFGFIYTTDLLPKGEKEIEQWLTDRNQKIAGNFNLVEERTAFEYGLADNFQIALYATYDWMTAYHNGPFGATTPAEQFSYDHPGPDDHYSASRFVGISAEGVYRLLSPYTDPIGLALYLEPTVGPAFLEAEAKLILQKNYLDDTLIFGFNFTYAPEFRLLSDDSATPKTWQEETDINFYLGASYRFIPNWSAGFEFLNEREFNDSYDFVRSTTNGFYVGPSLHFGAKSFFVTGVFLTQLPWATVNAETVPGTVVNNTTFDNDFEKYRLRLKFGFYL